MSYVPIINLDRDPRQVARELDDACAAVGFFQIVGYGVPEAIVDRAWRAATAFFDLPLAERMRVAAPVPGYPYGYSPYATESLSKSLGTEGSADLKEVFNVGPVDPPSHAFHDPDEASVYSPNLWPDVLPELRTSWTEYYRAMNQLGCRLMSLFSRALRLPPDFFDDKINHPTSGLRAINYPPQEHPPAPGQLRAGAHTDYGTFTMLRQDAVGGLEVLGHSGNWIGVETVPGALVVNIGDLLARWTNDRWRSTMHRVVNPRGDDISGATRRRRQSMPFFHNANWDAEVRCISTCLQAGQAPKYPPVLAGPHLMAKFRKTVTA